MGREASSCSPHEQVPSRCSSTAATPEIPKKLRLLSQQQKLGWALARGHRGSPSCPCPAHRYQPSWPHATDTGGCQEAGGHFLLAERSAAPLGSETRLRTASYRAREGLAGGKGHRGEQRPRGPGLPFPSPRGRHRALDPAPPEPRAKPEGASQVPAPAPRGCPGAGRARAPAETMSAEPHSPAGSQASSSAHQQHPRGTMAGSRPPPPPPPPPGDVAPTVPPLPWHLSWAGRCLRLQSPPSLPAPSAGTPDKRAAGSFKNVF